MPWNNLLSSVVVLTWISCSECPGTLLHPPPEPVFGVTCLIAIPRALTCSKSFCGVLTDTHSTQLPRTLREVSMYCYSLGYLGLPITRRANPGLSLFSMPAVPSSYPQIYHVGSEMTFILCLPRVCSVTESIAVCVVQLLEFAI